MNRHSDVQPQDHVAVDKPADKLCHCCRTVLPETANVLLCRVCFGTSSKSKAGQLLVCTTHRYEYDPSAVAS